MHSETKRIVNDLGRYHRSFETKDFIFFVNFQECDMNAAVIMYRKSDLSLASNNYFAGEYLYELIIEKSTEFTYLSRMAQQEIKLLREAVKG